MVVAILIGNEIEPGPTRLMVLSTDRDVEVRLLVNKLSEVLRQSQQRVTGGNAAQALEESAHARDEESAPEGVFRKEGDYWTLSWAGSESRLAHRKGMHHIARLLQYPGREFAAADLVAGTDGAAASAANAAYPAEVSIVRSLGDSGPALDATAKAQYRRRLRELRGELEEAHNLNDPGRAGKICEEIEFIEAELCACAGLRGRHRKQGAHEERARLAVTKAIKTSLSRIRQAHPGLGRHLALAIQTGYFCCYQPGDAIDWQF